MRFYPLLALFLLLSCSGNGLDYSKIREGDIIFQETAGEQSQAVREATGSRYTHCGIIFKDQKKYVVLEAVQPVGFITLKDFIRRGVDSHYVIKRLSNHSEVLNHEMIAKMKALSRQYLGKDYDLSFGWSNERIYCSELVWKLYKEAAGIEVGKLRRLSNFNLSGDTVKTLLSKRYGSNIPYDEPVVSPQDIFESGNLIETMRNE